MKTEPFGRLIDSYDVTEKKVWKNIFSVNGRGIYIYVHIFSSAKSPVWILQKNKIKTSICSDKTLADEIIKI